MGILDLIKQMTSKAEPLFRNPQADRLKMETPDQYTGPVRRENNASQLFNSLTFGNNTSPYSGRQPRPSSRRMITMDNVINNDFGAPIEGNRRQFQALNNEGSPLMGWNNGVYGPIMNDIPQVDRGITPAEPSRYRFY